MGVGGGGRRGVFGGLGGLRGAEKGVGGRIKRCPGKKSGAPLDPLLICE